MMLFLDPLGFSYDTTISSYNGYLLSIENGYQLAQKHHPRIKG